MRRIAVILVGALCMAGAATAQESSPSSDLLARAVTSLNSLRYTEADSVAHMVLALGDRVRRAQRREALEIIAAAYYPDPAGGGREEPDSAMAYLRQVVRLEPDSGLQKDFTWHGLDSLMEIARHTTFSPSFPVEGAYTLTGAEGEVRLAVHATRPALFAIALVSPQGAAVETDSTGPGSQGSLRLQSFRDGKPALADGAYRVQLSAKDVASGETVTRTFAAQVSAPPLELLPVPAALDSSQLKPEMQAPARGRGVFAGLLTGAATVAAASLLRGSNAVTSAFPVDGRAYVVGGGIALGGILAGLMDRGRPLPANVLANAQLRASFQSGVTQARAENAKRVAAYQATITIAAEAP